MAKLKRAKWEKIKANALVEVNKARRAMGLKALKEFPSAPQSYNNCSVSRALEHGHNSVKVYIDICYAWFLNLDRDTFKKIANAWGAEVSENDNKIEMPKNLKNFVRNLKFNNYPELFSLLNS